MPLPGPLEVTVARQPIFDRSRAVVAYELLFRGSAGERADVLDGDSATAQVILGALTEIGMDRVTGSEPVFVNCTRHFLENDPILAPDRCVLEVLENIAVDDTLVEGVRRLRAKGYRIALDDFTYTEQWEPLLRLAEFVKMDIRANTPGQLQTEVKRLSKYPLILLAEKVETEQELQFCTKLGFTLFQGYYLRKPEMVSGRRSPLARSAVLGVIAELMNPDADLGKIATGISSDMSLSYRLLRFANSGLVPVHGRIDSIQQAVGAVGTDMLLRWAALLALTRIDDSPSGYVETALQRARACELIAQQRNRARPEQAYMVGLFSLLDSMLQIPMDQIVPTLPLSDDLREALERGTGELGTILAAVQSYESGDRPPIEVNGKALQKAYWDGVSYGREMMHRLNG